MSNWQKPSLKRQLFDLFRSLFQNKLFERILIKFVSNREYGLAITKIVPNHYQYAKNTYRYAKRNKINYKLDLSDIIDWFIYFDFKETSKNNLFQLANKGDTVIDIGGNIGEISMNFASIVGDSGNVHSFEPHPINLKRFKNNLSLNDFNNIILNEQALGNEKGIFQLLIIDENNYGRNRITTTVEEKKENKLVEDVQVILLDDYVKKCKVEKVDLIKIDVEGFEMNVLKGAKNILGIYHPVLFIEVDDNNLRLQNSSSEELVEFLMAYDYILFFAHNNKAIPKNYNYSNCHFDLLAKK